MGTILFHRPLPRSLWPEVSPGCLLDSSGLIWVAEELISFDRAQSALVAAAEAIRDHKKWLEFDLREHGVSGSSFVLPPYLQLPAAELRIGFNTLVEAKLALGGIDTGNVRLAADTIKKLIHS